MARTWASAPLNAAAGDGATEPAEGHAGEDARAILDALAARASCRAFDGSAIAPDVLEAIVCDGLEAPSSCNHQNWHFIIVTDEQAKRRAHDIAGGNPHFLDCSALIYLCFQKGWTHGNFSIVQSVAGAAYHMMLSAHLRGFRCIWNAGIGDHAALRDLLGLPPIFEVQGALAIGRARAEAPTLKAPRRPKGEVYSWGRFERPAHAVYPVKPAEAYPFVAIRNDDNPFAQWDPAQWSWAQLADFRGYAVWAKSPLAGVYVSRRQGAAQAIELTLLPALPRGAHVVDVMPWGGTGTVALANAVGTADLTLADLSPHNLTFMRARLAAEGVDGARLAFSQMQGPHLSLGDETVDLVVLSQVLEHAPEPEALLDEAHRVLRPGGTVLLSARNSDSAYGARWRAEESRGQVPNQGPFIPIPARKVQALLRARFAIEAECGIGETEGGDAARLDGAAALTGRLYAARGRRA